jgi:hypothetical protein
MKITDASQLTDHELTRTLGRLAANERQVTLALIVHLAEFEARRLYEPAGFPSLFAYCRAVLHLSEDAIYNRIQTARAARRFPEIVDMLADGRLSPTTARMLARHLTDANHQQLLAEAAGMGKREVEELRARHFPQRDVRPSVRKLPGPRRAGEPSSEGTTLFDGPLPSETTAPPGSTVVSAAATTPSTPPTLAPERPRQLVRPLAPERYEIRFTADADIRALLQQAQDLLGHAVPSGDIAAIFGRALSLLVADLRKKKFGATSRPRPARPSDPRGAHKPMHVRREVSARDDERCAFVSEDGRRCGARRSVEFHHVIAAAVGGETTADNLGLRCRAHNGYEVDLFFGPGKRYRRPEPGSLPSSAPMPAEPGPQSLLRSPAYSTMPNWARTPLTRSGTRSGTS